MFLTEKTAVLLLFSKDENVPNNLVLLKLRYLYISPQDMLFVLSFNWYFWTKYRTEPRIYWHPFWIRILLCCQCSLEPLREYLLLSRFLIIKVLSLWWFNKCKSCLWLEMSSKTFYNVRTTNVFPLTLHCQFYHDSCTQYFL